MPTCCHHHAERTVLLFRRNSLPDIDRSAALDVAPHKVEAAGGGENSNKDSLEVGGSLKESTIDKPLEALEAVEPI